MQFDSPSPVRTIRSVGFAGLVALLATGLLLGSVATVGAHTANASGNAAVTDPTPPPAFYGQLTVDGDPAQAGVTVEAYVDGERRGSIVTEDRGEYGGPGGTEQKLVVDGGEADEGKTITFYVDGQQADQTATWESGAVVELNVSAPSPPADDPPSTDPPTDDPPTDDPPSGGQPTDKPPSGGQPTDEPTTDRPTTDTPTTDKPTTDRPTTDAPTTDRPTTDSPTSTQSTTDHSDPPGSETTSPPESGSSGGSTPGFTAGHAIVAGLLVAFVARSRLD